MYVTVVEHSNNWVHWNHNKYKYIGKHFELTVNSLSLAFLYEVCLAYLEHRDVVQLLLELPKILHPEIDPLAIEHNLSGDKIHREMRNDVVIVANAGQN